MQLKYKEKGTMGNKKLQVWLPMLFSLVLIAGMYFGFRLRENTPSSKKFLKVDRATSIQEIMDLVRRNYVDSVRLDSLQYDAINEMMGHLDPHSVFIPASDLQDVNEDITGNFEGIGVEFNIFSDTVHILYVLPGGPSEKTGLQVGDRIVKVNNENITGPTITSDLVRKKIRGERGTNVSLAIVRNNTLKNVIVTRGTIPLPALDAAYMLEPGTAYIKLNKFSESAYEEFMRSLEELKEKGAKKLIFDLRGNGGGLMNEAVEIADEFLDDNKLVVYTEGLNTKKREYKCKRPGLFEEGKLVVLVDELSASASEVLAGALQDWDRATIIGRRTFGKGLVQEQFELSDGSALRLTVARYYTPVGRSIQRSYEGGKQPYMDEILDRYHSGAMVNADSNKVINGKMFRTLIKKREVYGGGGIMPDIFVPIDTSSLPSEFNTLVSTGVLNNFLYEYYMQHRDEISRYKSPTEYSRNFNKMDDAWKNLVSYAAKDSIILYNIQGKDREYLEGRIKAQLARFRWRVPGFYEVINSSDSVVLKALMVN